MEYNDFILKQSGRNLTLLDSSKIIINKYDNKVARIVFELDPTIPGRFYFAMKNPITNLVKYIPIIKNHIVIGTDISVYPGRWDSILLAVEDNYEIVDGDIDQTKFTYVCNTFKRIVVRDNFLQDENIEEIENPSFIEILESLIKAQDRLENASIEAVEAADSARADKESVEDLVKQIDDINATISELQDYIDAIKAIRNEVRDYKYNVEDIYEESKQILITINARLDSVEELASAVARDKLSVEETITSFNQDYDIKMTEMLNTYNQFVNDINSIVDEKIPEIVENYLKENPVSITETDPTVPEWAKQPNRPSYTATDVGAEPAGTADNLIRAHDSSTTTHKDLRQAINNKVDETHKYSLLNLLDSSNNNLQYELKIINGKLALVEVE